MRYLKIELNSWHILGWLLLTLGCEVAHAQSSKDSEEEPLPDRAVVIDIDAPERSLYKMAVVDFQGNTNLGKEAAGVLRNDFSLVSLFNVLDPKSFIADPKQEGLGLATSNWTPTGAQGVIKGRIDGSGGRIAVEMRLYELAKGSSPTLTKKYRGGSASLRRFAHQFANEVLKTLTGKAGGFDSRITFARRLGRGKKAVYVADWDGHGVGQVSRSGGISMLPNFGPGGVWYSKMTERGMYITKAQAGEKPIIAGDGMNMGVAACGGKIYFSSTRSGNADIYSANPDGSGIKRLTSSRAIDVSPACGPGGQIAFVSNRHGGPQIFVMDADGGGVRRVTYKGNYNQTPAWCPDPEQRLIAFTGRGGGSMDIFTVDLKTGKYTRLTQGQGENKDPAFSPDCRMVAFASSRGGIFVSNPEGLNHNLVVKGAAETIHWSH